MILLLNIGGSLCHCLTFVINGVSGDEDDFGDKYDRDMDGAEDYCCGDMQFTRNPSTNDILVKYKISEDEYLQVCEKLEKGLSFGSCGWCS